MVQNNLLPPRFSNILPPDLSLEMPPAVALNSGIGAPLSGIFNFYLNLLSLSSDNTFWFVNDINPGQNDICNYTLNFTQPTQVYSVEYPVLSISAVSASEVYFVVDADSGAYAGTLNAGQFSNLGGLPDGATIAAISAASDGTLWALDSSGNTYQYSTQDAAFLSIVSSGLVFSLISAGSAGTVVGMARQNEQGSMPWQWLPDNGWVSLTSMNTYASEWIAACGDGSLWGLSGTTLTVAMTNGFVKSMDVSSLVNNGYFGWCAGNGMCAYAVGGMFDNSTGVVAVPIAVGVLDLPTQPWPSMTTDQQSAYNAITTQLNLSPATGIRGYYSDSIATLTSYQNTIGNMSTPNGVTPADWEIVQSQIYNELTYVIGVNNLFSQIGVLTGYYSILQTLQVNAAYVDVGLTSHNPPPSEVTIILDSLVSTLVTKLGTLFPPPYGLAVSLIGSGIMAASTYTQQQYSPNSPSGTLQVQYSDFVAALAQNMVNTVTQQGNQQTAIVTDWGKLSSAGQAISQGIWFWPDDLNGQSLNGLEPELQLYFYQSLMPAVWQILQGEIVAGIGPPPVAYPQAPDYAYMNQFLEGQNNTSLLWYYICCYTGSTNNIIQNNGPYPSASVMQNINSLVDDMSDFFSGQNGWSLSVVQSPGWTAPPAEAQWQFYDES